MKGPRIDNAKALEVGCRIVMGSTFCLSGGLKLISPLSLQPLLNALFGADARFAVFLDIVLSIFEISLGLLFLGGKFLRVASFTAGLFLLGSIAAATPFLESPIPCGCFGSLIDSKTNATFVTRNLLLLFTSLYLLHQTTEQREHQKSLVKFSGTD